MHVKRSLYCDNERIEQGILRLHSPFAVGQRLRISSFLSCDKSGHASYHFPFGIFDTVYDNSNFLVRQVFFCGGDKKELEKSRKGLDNFAKSAVKKNAERTLKIEIDDEALDPLYGLEPHPFAFVAGQRVAVRVISQFGEEAMKVLG